ncbi:MAG: KGK domain-containing protein [Nostoc sp.]
MVRRNTSPLSSDENKEFINETNKYRLGFSDDDRFKLDDEDVISGISGFDITTMLKFNKLVQAILSWIILKHNYLAPESKWFTEEGCKCEVLLTKGGGWQKGRFRFRLEFIPDKPEVFLKNSPSEDEKSQVPLDDLRSQLDDLQSQLNIE